MKIKNYLLIFVAGLLLYSCNNNSDAQILEKVVLKSIEITTLPTKTTYCENELFTSDGMEVKANYSDNKSKFVTDFTCTPSGKLSVTDKIITVSYTEENITVTTSIPIRVCPNYNVTFNYETAKDNYTTFTITGGLYNEESGIITLTPTKEKEEYILSGYFNGQIINNTKNTVLTLNGVYIENTTGNPAILSTKKMEISVKENTDNYIISTGEANGKKGTIYCYDSVDDKLKNLEIGGKGKCYILGFYHGIKADEVKAKGSGIYYITGTNKGSAINCNSFVIESEKNITLCLGNAKNGIKADETISISSGTLWLENVTTGLKTDTTEDKPDKEYFIKLSDCKIYTKNIKDLYSTEKDSYITNNIVLGEIK